MQEARFENRAEYVTHTRRNRKCAPTDRAKEDAVIAEALAILSRRMREKGAQLTSPQAVRDYLRISLAEREREYFVCIWLDAQHRVIAQEELFAGSLTEVSVHPREVIKRALAHNAAAVIVAHNHPSGVSQPSMADKQLTSSLKDTLAMVQVKLLDHLIVAGLQTTSFAEMGLL